MPSLRSLLAFALLAATSVDAGGFGRESKNWGCDNSQASTVEKKDCSGAGSFYTYWGSMKIAVCVSSKTKTPPRDLDCPLNWSMHSRQKVCIPPKEVSQCDCGEGYSWNGNQRKCTKPTTGTCKKGSWYHARTRTCVPEQPNQGQCPSGKTCPGGWYWCKDTLKCRPEKPKAPTPDCDDWDEKHQCCQHPSTPSHKPNDPPKNNHGKHRRVLVEAMSDNAPKARTESEQAAFQQEELNAMYCPSQKHACSVNGSAFSTDQSWSYECLDVLTELESCGGCASTGQGVDCTTLPGVGSVTCTQGRCHAYTCTAGYMLVDGTCV